MTPKPPTSDTPAVAVAISAPLARAKSKPTRKIGQRPRLLRLTPKLRAAILEMILEGVPLSTAAVASGIPKRTFFEWLAKGRDDGAEDPYLTFAIEVDEAQEAWAARSVQRIDAAGDKDYRALTWLLERRRPEEFGDHSRAAHVNVQITAQSIVASPEWQEIEDRLMAALRPFPAALAAVVQALGPGEVPSTDDALELTS